MWRIVCACANLRALALDKENTRSNNGNHVHAPQCSILQATVYGTVRCVSCTHAIGLRCRCVCVCLCVTLFHEPCQQSLMSPKISTVTICGNCRGVGRVGGVGGHPRVCTHSCWCCWRLVCLCWSSSVLSLFTAFLGNCSHWPFKSQSRCCL